MSINKAPKPANPVLIDRVLASLQDTLVAKLSWLDFAFGRAQRLVTKKGNVDYYYPGVFTGDKEYRNVLPGEHTGNFSFFVISDPQTVDYVQHQRNNITATFSLIFWYNLSKIYSGTNERKTEQVKAEILKVITEAILPAGRITVEKIYEQAENIYKGYSLKEIETQFLMHPFGGIRIEGEILVKESC